MTVDLAATDFALSMTVDLAATDFALAIVHDLCVRSTIFPRLIPIFSVAARSLPGRRSGVTGDLSTFLEKGYGDLVRLTRINTRKRSSSLRP